MSQAKRVGEWRFFLGSTGIRPDSVPEALCIPSRCQALQAQTEKTRVIDDSAAFLLTRFVLGGTDVARVLWTSFRLCLFSVLTNGFFFVLTDSTTRSHPASWAAVWAGLGRRTLASSASDCSRVRMENFQSRVPPDITMRTFDGLTLQLGKLCTRAPSSLSALYRLPGPLHQGKSSAWDRSSENVPRSCPLVFRTHSTSTTQNIGKSWTV